MYKYLLCFSLLLVAGSYAKGQEVLLTQYETFSIEPGRMMRIDQQLVTRTRLFRLEVVKATDIQIDSSRKALRLTGYYSTGEAFFIYLDPAEAYGVLNLLNMSQRSIPIRDKGAPMYSYITSNGVQAYFSFPENTNSWWSHIYITQLYAYSNVPQPERKIAIRYVDAVEFIAFWKEALETLKTL